MSRLRRRVVLGLSAVTVVTLATATPALADKGWHGKPPTDLPKVPLMVGSGGAVSSVDRDASQVGIDVLARGGNAADAAVATAAALGVTEPYSAGIGGGGFLVYYDAKYQEGQHDGRPRDGAHVVHRQGLSRSRDRPAVPVRHRGLLRALRRDAGHSGALGQGRPHVRHLVARRAAAARRAAGGARLRRRPDVLRPDRRERRPGSRQFPATAAVFLPGGQPPAVGSTFRNPDLATAYRELRTHGIDSLYGGQARQAVVAEAQHPSRPRRRQRPQRPADPGRPHGVPGALKAPITSQYKGVDVYGMPVPSSGGIAVAEILNLVEAYEKKAGTSLSSLDNASYLHWFSEASGMAFADRNRYVGDVSGVPVEELTSDAFAAERACQFDTAVALTRPIPYGTPDGSYTSCSTSGGRQGEPYEGQSTTHLVTADKWGNVASYTLTIEQTGGSGITVPGYGFLLNNELTDFNFTPLSILPAGTDPNLPGPGKRPRSSMSPTIIVKDGKPFLTVGSPGGATIITSVAQTILGYLDRNLSLVDAIAAARLSSRNGAEGRRSRRSWPALTATRCGQGHTLVSAGTPNEIGAVTAIHPLGGNTFEAAAETCGAAEARRWWCDRRRDPPAGVTVSRAGSRYRSPVPDRALIGVALALTVLGAARARPRHPPRHRPRRRPRPRAPVRSTRRSSAAGSTPPWSRPAVARGRSR